MAGFTILPISGFEVVQWTDPNYGNLAGRTGPLNAVPLRRIRGVATLSTPIVLDAVLPGATVHAADSLLGGVLYSWTMVEYPGVGPDSYVSAPGHSGRLSIVAHKVGHYCVRANRVGFGAVLFHFDRDP